MINLSNEELSAIIFSFEESNVKIENFDSALIWKYTLDKLYKLQQENLVKDITDVERKIIISTLNVTLNQGIEGKLAYFIISALEKLLYKEKENNNETNNT